MPRLLNTPPRLLENYRKAAVNCVRDQAAQSLIELAIVLPAFFMLMIGFINFCLVMLGVCNVSYATRQADRYACLHSQTSLLPASQSDIDSIVAPNIFKYPTNTYTDTLSYGSGGNVVGGTANVKVTITYNIVIVFLKVQSIALTSTASGTIVQ